MRLRITGRVPQMVGGEDALASAAEECPASVPDLAPRDALAPARATVAWPQFTAWQGVGAPARISHCGGAPYGSLLETRLPCAQVSFASLVLTEATPAPAGRNAVWAI
jgi:hypothetical protein